MRFHHKKDPNLVRPRWCARRRSTPDSDQGARRYGIPSYNEDAIVREVLKLVPLNTVPIHADPVRAGTAAEELDGLAASIMKVHQNLELVTLPDHGRLERNRDAEIIELGGRRIG